MLLSQRWEIGVLEALTRPDVLPLFVGAWVFLLLGVGVQLLLLKKCTGLGRWAVVIFSVATAVICEVGVRVMGGWDGVLFAVGARYAVYPLLGAGLCAVVCWVKSRK